MENNKIKHLEFIQNIISRMANNSFSLKCWSVTIIAGVFLLSNKDVNNLYFLIAFVPILFFWALDSFYLYQERLYRVHYDKIRILEGNTDFNLNVNSNDKSFLKCIISKTELLFYLPLLIIVLIVFFIV